MIVLKSARGVRQEVVTELSAAGWRLGLRHPDGNVHWGDKIFPTKDAVERYVKQQNDEYERSGLADVRPAPGRMQ